MPWSAPAPGRRRWPWPWPTRLRVHVRLDERSAGFFAIGLSMATGAPTVICVTSGTAAAELHPAVVEAHQGRVPLIVCTADRPPELHHVGASQTIDQVGLFTTSTRWACDPGVPEESQAASWRPLAARAIAEARDGPLGPGPVHLNLAFREPLIGAAGPLPARSGPVARPVPPRARRPRLAPLGGRGLLIAGANATSDPARLLLLGERLGWPILADPRSGCRLPGTIAAADAIVRTQPPLPDTVVLLGAPWLSKVLERVRVERGGGWRARRLRRPVVAVDRPAGRGERVPSRRTATSWIDAALESAVPTDPEWLVDVAVVRVGGAGRDRAQRSPAELSEPSVARVLARHAAAVDGTHHGVGVHADARSGMVQPGLARRHRS